jgi:hypothetical protein
MALAISNTTKKSPFSVTSSGTPSYSTNQTNPTVKGNSAFGGLFSIGQQGQVVPKATTSAPAATQQRAPALQTAPIQTPMTSLQTPPLSPVQAATTQAPQQVRGVLSYPGLVNEVVSASRPSERQTGLVERVSKTAEGNLEIGRQAAELSKQYGERIAEVGRLGAGAVAGDLTTGTDVVGSGNAAIASQSASSRMQALSAAQQAALQGTAQQLTGQGQAASAYNAALGGANTQQQQQLGGLGTAAGFAQPSTAPFGQTVFNPLTGQYEGVSGLDPQTQATNLAQQVMSGRMTYDQALSSLGYAGQVGSNFLNNAITGAGGNPLQLQSQGAAQQSNIQTQGQAQTDIARQGLGQATQDYVQMIGAAQFAGQQADAVKDILIKTGLNNVSSTDYTKVLNNLQGRFSSSDFVALNTALREAQIAYTNLLSTGGGTPTGNEQNAVATLNVNQSASAIKASISQLENAVARRLQALEGVRSQYEQNLGGSSSSYNGGGGTTGGTGTITWDSLGD